jgi:hypothetical protein
MKTGMLWFDNDPATDLQVKINRAAAYYQKKYGQKPDLCFVHPSMLAKDPPTPDGIELRSNRQILPHHLWLGIHDVLVSKVSGRNLAA